MGLPKKTAGFFGYLPEFLNPVMNSRTGQFYYKLQNTVVTAKLWHII